MEIQCQSQGFYDHITSMGEDDVFALKKGC